MNRSLALAVLAVISTSACSSSSDDQPSGAAPDAAGGGTSLIIQSFKYAPSPLTVRPGAKVEVSNKDGAAHTVTSSDGQAFESGDIGGSASRSFTAPKAAGTYTYICRYHSSMHGTLVVQG